MFKRISFLFFALFFITFAQTVLAQNSSPKAAPDFTLSDNNGKKYTLSQLKGKVVILEWINFGCPFVKKHYKSKNMQALQKKYMEKGVIWLSICSSAPGKQGHFTNKEVALKLKEKDFNGKAYLIDSDGEVGKKYGAKVTPHMFIINKEGYIVYDGAIDSIPSTKVADINEAKNYIDAVFSSEKGMKQFKQNKPYGCSVKYK